MTGGAISPERVKHEGTKATKTHEESGSEFHIPPHDAPGQCRLVGERHVEPFV
jgi:hypothetical protein